MATPSERVATLRHLGYQNAEIAALLDLSPADVAAVDYNPAAPVEARGVDLSAVDQDITVLNSHKLTMQGAPETPQKSSLWFEGDQWQTYLQATPEAYSTDVFILAPEATPSEGVSVAFYIGGGAPEIKLRSDSATASFALEADRRVGTSADLLFSTGRAPILRSPDTELHRLKVANDGSLSTEPVT